MRSDVRDTVDIAADDSAMPDWDVWAQENVADDGCVGSDEDSTLIEDVEVIKVHDVTGATDLFAVFSGGLESFGWEESAELSESFSQHQIPINNNIISLQRHAWNEFVSSKLSLSVTPVSSNLP